MSSAFSRRVVAVSSALALGAACTLASTPAFAADEPAPVEELAPVQELALDEPVEQLSVVGPLTPADNTAPTYTISQAYQSKEGGRTAVTLTFNEPIHPKSVGQGWNGSGTTFTKVYYLSKTYSATFADMVGNGVTVSIPVDASAPSATVTQAYQTKEGGRTAVTIVASEPITGLGQGWYGSGTTWTKVYYTTKTQTVSFTDLIGYPGSVTFTVDGPPAIASAVQTYETKEGGRARLTLTFTEPVKGLGQGWTGSGTTWSKVYYSPKTAEVSFSDAFGYTVTKSVVVGPIVP